MLSREMERGASRSPMPQASSPKSLRTNRAPFRIFFPIAALEAVLGAAHWLPSELKLGITNAASAAEWHRNAFLFGMVPAILAGFLLTALPRWTGRPAVTRPTVTSLAGLWLLSRIASLFSSQAGLIAAALFALSLTLIAAACVATGRDRRNVKVVVLLACFSVSAVLTAGGWHPDLAIRVAVASIVGLMAVIGGRVVPALTESYVHSIGGQPLVRRSPALDAMAGLATAGTLIAWIAIPQAPLTGALCAISSLLQLLRLAQWRGWQAGGNGSILALHIGYCWIAIGFALMAIHILAAEHLQQAAAVHAWTTGAIGTLGLAIMSSMIRKHTGHSFISSWPATAAFVSVTLSTLARLAAEASPINADTWIVISAGLWIGAFGWFLMAWRRELWPAVRHQGP